MFTHSTNKKTGEASPELIEKFKAEFGDQTGLTAPQPKDTGRTCPECAFSATS